MTPVCRGGFGSSADGFLKIQCITVEKKKKNRFPIFAQDPVSQSHSLPQGRGFKIFDTRGLEIFLRKNLKKLFRNDIRYVGSAPERLFVTTYGTLVRRQRVKIYWKKIMVLKKFW